MASVSTRLHVYYSVYCTVYQSQEQIGFVLSMNEVIHESIPSKAIQHINYSPTTSP